MIFMIFVIFVSWSRLRLANVTSVISGARYCARYCNAGFLRTNKQVINTVSGNVLRLAADTSRRREEGTGSEI